MRGSASAPRAALGVDGQASDGEVEDYQVTISSFAAGVGVFTGKNPISEAADWAYVVFATDLDGDGDTDVLIASVLDSTIAWYENDGSENFTRYPMSEEAFSAISVFAADVNDDGDMDVLSASLNDNTIAWYANDGSQNFTPSRDHHDGRWGSHSVFAADLDGDGDTGRAKCVGA